MANLVVEYAVDFQLDLFTDAVLGPTVWSEDFRWSLCARLKTDRNRSEKEGRSVVREKVWLDKSFGRKPFAYHSIPDRDHEGSRDWTLAKSRYRPEDLESIPWDVVRQGQVRFGLRWSRCRSWLCFCSEDGLLVEEGVLKTSYRRWVAGSMQMVVREQIAGLVPLIPFRANTRRGDRIARAVQDVSKPTGFRFPLYARGNFHLLPAFHFHFRRFWRDRSPLSRPSFL